jgi:hypothetical protein
MNENIFLIEVKHQNRNGRTKLNKIFYEHEKAVTHCRKLLDKEEHESDTYYIKEFKEVTQ